MRGKFICYNNSPLHHGPSRLVWSEMSHFEELQHVLCTLRNVDLCNYSISLNLRLFVYVLFPSTSIVPFGSFIVCRGDHLGSTRATILILTSLSWCSWHDCANCTWYASVPESWNYMVVEHITSKNFILFHIVTHIHYLHPKIWFRKCVAMDDQQVVSNLEKSSNIDCSNNESFKYEDLSKIHVL